MARFRGAVVAVVAASSLFFAQGAGAAIEVGNNCVASAHDLDRVATQLTRAAPEPTPLTVPADGVVTRWRVNLAPFQPDYPLRFKVFRRLDSNSFTVAGESVPVVVHGGINLFDTRIPVRAGDQFGTEGAVQYCGTSSPADLIGRTASASLGETIELDNQEEQLLVAGTGIVEPDADGDGYGDETQDKCTISAARQDPCPPVVHQATAIIKKKAVLVLVTASGHTSVTVGATVKLPGGGTARLAPVSHEVAPPNVGRFLLKLPKSVLAARAALPKGKSLQLIAKATVTDDVGRVDSANGKFKLR